MTSVCAASLLAAAGGSGSLAGDLIPQRPAVEDAQVLLYEGQKTAFGIVDTIQIESFSLGADGASYVLARLDDAGNSRRCMLRFAPGASEPELVVSSGAVTTSGDSVLYLNEIALLPSQGPVMAVARLDPPSGSSHNALVRVDSPESITVLVREGDPAPPPLTGTLDGLPTQMFNSLSETHVVGQALVRLEPLLFTFAIVRLSIDGEMAPIAAVTFDGVERIDANPGIGPDSTVVYGTTLETTGRGASESIAGLSSHSVDGVNTPLVWAGDPVSGTPEKSVIDHVNYSSTGFFPDAHRIGVGGDVYTTAFLTAGAGAGSTASSLIRVTESGAHSLLRNLDIDPSGATSIYRAVRPFRDGSLVATQGARTEIWFADGAHSQAVVDASTVFPGFAPESTLSGSIQQFMGPRNADLDRDRVVFHASITETIDPQPPSMESGMFTLSELGELELLVRSGDMLISGGAQREILEVQPPGVVYKTDDASGQVLLNARLSDGADALVRLVRVVHDIGPEPCPGDVNGDRVVNFSDLNAVLSDFGMQGAMLAADLNADGVVNFADLNLVLSAFGAQCE